MFAQLLKTFPSAGFSPIALILLFPLLGAIVNGIWGKRLGKQAVTLMALSMIGLSFLTAVITFLSLHQLVGASGVSEGAGEAAKHAHLKLSWTAWEWMKSGGIGTKVIPIDLTFSVDALSGVMLLVVTGVGFLIHVYSASYMAADKAYWRFFCYLNLFVFSMLVLILGDNLPVLFVGWEGVGLCSYLLIGFWYEKAPNAAAGKKAFIANRVGDFGLICGMFLLAYYCGSLDWTGIQAHATDLVTTNDAQRVHIWPVGNGQYSGIFSFLQPGPHFFGGKIHLTHPVTISAATAVGLMIFLGCCGKSAQIPLYVWLPDAMAGPTPVSALIHAATMVTAGIYLVCRLNFVFILAPAVMMLIAFTGAATALFAATIALVQTDIKKVLAYSTVSQLGFMFVGVGSGAFTAGLFHVFTHAFFKACLFLGAGSVIHAMHARIHDDEKSQDMRNMGGLGKYMPYTFYTFAAATAAIVGFPFTSGFFSKDEILFKAFANVAYSPAAKQVATASKGKIGLFDPEKVWLIGHSFGTILYAMGLLAATLTAFYMSRSVIMTFLGDFRGWKIGRASRPPPQAHDDHHHDEDLTQPGSAPHESPWPMTFPLIILATAAVFAGFLNPGLLKHWMPLPLDHWLDPVFEETMTAGVRMKEGAEKMEWGLTFGAFAAFAIGSGVAYWMYVIEKGAPAKKLAEDWPRLYRLVYDKWRVDEAYDKYVISGVDAIADTAMQVDTYIVDGIIARLTALIVAATGTVLRAVQNGVVHVYATVMVVGFAALTFFFVRAHAEAIVTSTPSGDYTVEAAPGPGYAYRFYNDAAGNPNQEAFTGDAKLKVHVDPAQKKTVRVEVKNVFGMKAHKDVLIDRPKKEEPMEIGPQ